MASPIERTFLWHKHREELPASVKDDCNPRLGRGATPATVERHVEDAREAFAPDSKPVAIIRTIADETSEAKEKADLAKTLCIGAAIQSRYGEFAANRQLFEPRARKRNSTVPPTVDADDPYGKLIGSFMLVGKSVEGFADRLRRRPSNREPHNDAPEFGVRVPVEIATERRHTAATMTVACRQKDVRPTRAATSLFAALAGTPYDVARAVHNLESETKAPDREIHLDEVRYALSTLAAKRLLPAMSKSALSRTVYTLLVAETPLIQSELADRAVVSTRWIRDHVERLAAFGFIR